MEGRPETDEMLTNANFVRFQKSIKKETNRNKYCGMVGRGRSLRGFFADWYILSITEIKCVRS